MSHNSGTKRAVARGGMIFGAVTLLVSGVFSILMGVVTVANRAFFVSYEGELLQCQNRGATPMDGILVTPNFGEAFTNPADKRWRTPGYHAAINAHARGMADANRR